MAEIVLRFEPAVVTAWLFATSGWLLDWLTTVWPNERMVERNPLVVRYFGKHPDPFWFGLAKIVTLVVFLVLFVVVEILVGTDEAAPETVLGLQTGLWIPVFVGVTGWAASLHNLRIRRRLRNQRR